METRNVKISFNQAEKYANEKACFGWVVVSKEDRGNQTVILKMQRDPKTIDDYKTTRKLEDQYERISRKVPTSTIVFTIIGIAALISYFVLKETFLYAISILVASLTSFAIAFLLLIMFLLLKAKKKSIVALILKEAAIRSGATKDYPSKNNIKPKNDSTWALTNTFSNK